MALDLGKQVGPLPLGAWIAVVGVGLGIALYSRGQSTPTEVLDDSGDPGVGTGETGGWLPTTPNQTPITEVAIDTNERWALAATNYLIASGYNPVLSVSAVTKYLNGMKLSTQEEALISIALQKYGAPPQSLPPSEGDSPTTPTTSVRAPTGFRAVATGTTAATVTWNKASGAVKYIVYANAGNGQRLTRETQSTRLVFKGLPRKQRIAMSVASIDSSGKRSGNTSNVITFTTR